MDQIINDSEYINIVHKILNNQDFLKIKNEIHHGINRYDHSLKVSYKAYRVAKRLGFNYTEVARAGLLHDFFFKEDTKKKALSLIKHPKKASLRSHEIFGINDMEKDIIETHMFPITIRPPKYMESWVVNLIDDIVTIKEISRKTKISLKFISSALLLFFIDFNL